MNKLLQAMMYHPRSLPTLAWGGVWLMLGKVPYCCFEKHPYFDKLREANSETGLFTVNGLEGLQDPDENEPLE